MCALLYDSIMTAKQTWLGRIGREDFDLFVKAVTEHFDARPVTSLSFDREEGVSAVGRREKDRLELAYFFDGFKCGLAARG